MSEKHWSDQMNEEYEAAKTDKERLAALEKHMSPRAAIEALSHLKSGAASGVRDLSKPTSTPDGRPDEGGETNDPSDNGNPD